MSPSEKPDPGDGEILAGLSRVRPQRRSARRVSSEPAPAVRAARAAPRTGEPAVAPTAPPAAKASTTTPKAARTKPVVAAPPLDHPVPAEMPGAPFAPPPRAEPAGGKPAPSVRPQDAGSLVLQAATDLTKAGVGVARAILGRLPRP